MTNTIKHKRNATPGAIPTTGNLSYGELAINYTDGKLYTKNNSNNIINLPVASINGANITPGLITTNSGVIINTGEGIVRLYASLGNGVDNSDIYFDTDSDADLHVAYKEGTTYIGTTAISLSRSSAAQTLTGTSIDGNAGSVTSGVYTTGNQTINGSKTFGSAVFVSNGIGLNNSTSNTISFNSNGLSTPASSFTPTAVGGKIILHPFTFGSASSFGFGIAGGGTGGSAPAEVLWSQVGKTSNSFDWYAATTKVATLTGSGVLTIQGGTSQINVDNLRLDGNTISATNTNGSIEIKPTGNGIIYFSSPTINNVFEFSPNTYSMSVIDNNAESLFSISQPQFSIQSEGGGDGLVFDRGNVRLGINLNGPSETLHVGGGIRFSPSTSVTLNANGQVSFERISNTQLRIKMRGTDGETRSTTLTLS